MTVFIIIIFLLAFIISILKAFLEDSNKKKSATTNTHRTNSIAKNVDNDLLLKKQYVADLLHQRDESTNIVNNTKNPETFFGRLGFIFDVLLELMTYEKYDFFTGSTPTKDYQKLLDNLETVVDAFIDRSYEAQLEKVSKLKSQTAKFNNMEKYFENLIAAFECADTFWTGNNKMQHYTGMLYTEKNKKRVYALYDDVCKEEKKLNEKSKEKIEQKSGELAVVENKVIDAPSSENETVSDLATMETPIGWEIAVSFGKSTSSNFDRALYLAKNANCYEETEYNGKKIYQAFFSSKPKSYLEFIKLYELVSGWKSTNVTINGEIVDRKIVSGLNWCYGDRCRTGKTNFCYGASEMTDNPFGCHRLQISRCNHPWWQFTNYNGVNYTVDKKAILERATDYSTAYRLCPAFNWEKIVHAIEELPDTIDSIESYELDGSFSINLIE